MSNKFTIPKKTPMNKIHTFICFIFIFHVVKAETLYPPQQLLEDFNFMIKTMEEVHPNLYFNISEDSFSIYADTIQNKLTYEMSSFDFYLLTTPLVNKIGDAHTGIAFDPRLLPPRLKRNYYEKNVLFPATIRYKENAIFIRHVIDNDFANIEGMQLTTINGINANQIIETLLPYVPQEFSHYTRYRFEAAFNDYLFTIMKLEPPFTVSLTNKDSHLINITMKGVSRRKLFQYDVDNKYNPYRIKDIDIKIKRKRNNYVFSTLENNTIGYIDFKSFTDYDEFSTFLRSVFKYIKKKKISHLIIDIRNNGGGNSRLGTLLISYVFNQQFKMFEKYEARYSEQIKKHFNISEEYMEKLLKSHSLDSNNILRGNSEFKEPFHNPLLFNGKVYLLTSSCSFSSAASLASAFKCYNMGTIVGQETGGLTSSYGDIYPFQLPNTKTKCVVSHKYFVNACGKPDGHGVIPDYIIDPDGLDSTSDALLFTLKLIESENKGKR